MIRLSPVPREELPESAAAIGCTTSRLNRALRAATGYSAREYRNQLRLREAASRIVLGTEPIAAIALRVGYRTHSHFSAAFREAFGLTPRALRASRRR